MKKVKDAPALTQLKQYCLEPQPVTKFIESLPKSINVYEMRWRGTYRAIAKKLAIPEYMKKCGVQNATNIPETVNITGTFKGGMSKDKMIKSMDLICKSYNVPQAKFHIQKIILMDTAKTNELTFRRMYKAIRLPDDKRKKKIVLGMTGGSGINHHNLLATLSAKQIICTMAKTEKTIVMCSEEIVVKGSK